MSLVAFVTALALIEFVVFGLQVGRARATYAGASIAAVRAVLVVGRAISVAGRVAEAKKRRTRFTISAPAQIVPMLGDATDTRVARV